MALFTRTYTFVDGTTAYGSQVESEIANIVTVLNSLNAATTNWGQVSISNATAVPLIADCAAGSQHIADFKNNSVIKASVDSAGVVTGTSLTAGASGTAGIISVFPTTSAKGKTTLTASDNGGNTTTNINTAAQAGARTYTVPDAGASASFVMTQGTQNTAGSTAAASGSLKEVGNIALTAGDWDINGHVVFEGQGGSTSFTALGNFDVMISTATAATTGSVQGYSRVKETQQSTSTSAYRTLVIPRVRVSLSGNQTYYLNASCVYTSTAPVLYGTINARRMR